LKTKLDLVVIDDSEEKARKRAQQFYKGILEQQIRDREFAIYGTHEDVSRQIDLLEEAGIQYLILHLEPHRELEELDTDNLVVNYVKFSIILELSFKEFII
jgi:alkanesulfonate monooxygenase SsuD/methylene tetrahydromethanopterin reductase-like flavin-dependent oxidoreductase (luciferase family)